MIFSSVIVVMTTKINLKNCPCRLDLRVFCDKKRTPKSHDQAPNVRIEKCSLPADPYPADTAPAVVHAMPDRR